MNFYCRCVPFASLVSNFKNRVFGCRSVFGWVRTSRHSSRILLLLPGACNAFSFRTLTNCATRVVAGHEPDFSNSLDTWIKRLERHCLHQKLLFSMVVLFSHRITDFYAFAHRKKGKRFHVDGFWHFYSHASVRLKKAWYLHSNELLF